VREGGRGWTSRVIESVRGEGKYNLLLIPRVIRATKGKIGSESRVTSREVQGDTHPFECQETLTALHSATHTNMLYVHIHTHARLHRSTTLAPTLRRNG
jgi:hypothetical protein